MIKDNLHFDAQEKLKAGIKKVAKAVGSTMGTGGSNAIIEAIESPGHLLTNDGYSIANNIILADPIEDMGRKILLEAINRANKASGDGSSTTCVLTDAILDEGFKHSGEGHPMDIKRSLEECLPLIEESLKAQSRTITVDDVHQVATVSAEDEQIGKTIGEIYKQIGKDGIINWDISKTGVDSYTIGTGITVEEATYASPYMCDATENGQNTNQIRIKNPRILITKQKLTSSSDFNAIAAALHGDDIKDLVVFVDDFDPLIVNDLVLTRAHKGFRIILVKMPVLWKDWWFEDLTRATNAKLIDPTAGFTMKNLSLADLGTVENILITKDATYLDGIADLTTHIEALKEEDTDDTLLRASRLNTKTARYYVGAHSDSALSYRRLKVEDAISAAYQALQGGIVAGGGVALRKIFSDTYTTKPPVTVGEKILHIALQSPEMQIWKNAGVTHSEYPGPSSFGVDTRTGKVVDMFEAGIIDPTNVVLNAVKNAISVAATVLTAPTVITLPRMEEPVSQGNLIQR